MDESTLQFLWYLVIGIAMLMYTVLDGFDLGVGSLHLFARTDQERRVFLNSIGPVWDGNEVWLVIIIGGMFAGFPAVYATVFSGFYTLITVLIACLMFRAAAIEFRSKRESKSWRHTWDRVFCVSSLMVSFIIGLGLGNFVIGVPLNSSGEFTGTLASFFQPYAVIVGLTGVALFMMHGAIYLVMKTEGEIHEHLRRWIKPVIAVFIFFYALTTITTVVLYPHMVERLIAHPWIFIVPLVTIAMIVNVILQIRKKNDGWAFLSSCFSILSFLILFGLGTYPTLVRSTDVANANSLTIYNSSSSPYTLKVLLIIVAIGVPLVLAYMCWIYRIFRGKVRLDHSSY
jgi:cytochrome bd ubiquinol oxidase subunit II